MMIFKEVIYKLRRKYRSYIFQQRLKNKGGKAGKPLFLSNEQYVVVGNNVRIKDGYRIECYPHFYKWDYKPKLILEDGVIIGHGFTGLVADTIKIGKNSIFAGNVTLISENHGMNPEIDTPYHAQELSTGPIEIGEGCWLGQNVSVLPGVKIGIKCIIATNAVVTKNIPDYCIAAGSPARIIKKYSFENHKWNKV